MSTQAVGLLVGSQGCQYALLEVFIHSHVYVSDHAWFGTRGPANCGKFVTECICTLTTYVLPRLLFPIIPRHPAAHYLPFVGVSCCKCMGTALLTRRLVR